MVLARAERQLVLHRSRRQLLLIEGGQLLGRWPVAVGMPGWETPSGQFRVLDKVIEPSWAHPETGAVTPSGSDTNPLGSRWIGFARDCTPKKAHDGERMLDIRGCTVAGFHGTPHRWTVGHAVSHGCVRLFDEDVRDVFDRVTVGTTVTVLP
jgi:lipoprotein-anchoring transpeptidase ErfK/SrfK